VQERTSHVCYVALRIAVAAEITEGTYRDTIRHSDVLLFDPGLIIFFRPNAQDLQLALFFLRHATRIVSLGMSVSSAKIFLNHLLSCKP
jgi:hypothetical protein